MSHPRRQETSNTPPPHSGGGPLVAVAVEDDLSHQTTDPATPLVDLVPAFLGWFRLIVGRAENTVTAYAKDLACFVRFCESLGINHPRQVTYRTVEMYMAWLQHRRGLKATTANRHRYAIQQLFRFLRREGIVTSDPVGDTFALKEPKRLPRYLMPHEQEHLLDLLSRDQTPVGLRDYALVATGLFCGLRVEEFTRLRLADIAVEAGRLRIIGKGDIERECVIVPRLAEILARYLARGRPALARGAAVPWFFVATEKGRRRRVMAAPLLTRSLFAMVRRKVSPIVGRPISPHQLRHSFASRLRENGADLQLIQEALGHANITTTVIYAHLSTAKRNAEIARYLQ